MNLTISGHHLEVTPALRGYVTHKLDRVLRHFDQVVDVRVLLSANVPSAISTSKVTTCLPSVPTKICMPPWMNLSTFSIAKWCVTKTAYKITTTSA